MLINLRNALMTGKRLPYDAEVEYLESTGTQWIDTGVEYSTDNAYAIKLHGKITTASAGIGWNAGGLIRNVNGRWDDGSGLGIGDANVFTNVAQTIEAGSSTNTYTTAGAFTFHRTHVSLVSYALLPYTLFGYVSENEIRRGNGIYLCQLSITINGVLVRDFIPVRKGTVGYLYDRVSGALFRNAGTGAFLIGPDKSAANGGGYKRKCVRRSYRRSLWPSARFWRPRLWKEVA